MGCHAFTKLTFPDRLLLSVLCLTAAAFISACSISVAPTPPLNIATSEAHSPVVTTAPTPYPTSTPYPTYTLYPTSTTYPTAAPPLPAAIGTVAGEYIQLIVREIPANLPQYDRDDWRHWTDADRDCQNTRHEVLIEESVIRLTFKGEDQCQVLSGLWLAPFSGVAVTEA
jgi:hypothetical protein